VIGSLELSDTPASEEQPTRICCTGSGAQPPEVGMEPALLIVLIMGPAMVLGLILLWRYFLRSDRQELEDHERLLEALRQQEEADGNSFPRTPQV
jgi:hypothetical protein